MASDATPDGNILTDTAAAWTASATMSVNAVDTPLQVPVPVAADAATRSIAKLTNTLRKALNDINEHLAGDVAAGIASTVVRFLGGISVGDSATVTTGTGTPEGVIVAPAGSVFLRTDGGAGATVYAKETGAGGTGWVSLGSVAAATALAIDPTINDDTGSGYDVGSVIVNTTWATDQAFMCTDATAAAAWWSCLAKPTIGGVSDVGLVFCVLSTDANCYPGSGIAVRNLADTQRAPLGVLTANAVYSGSAWLFEGTSGGIDFGEPEGTADIFAGGGTVSAWASVDSDGASGSGRVITKGASATSGWGLYLVGAGGPPTATSLRFFGRSSGTFYEWDVNVSEGTVSYGPWLNYTVTWDSDSPGTAPEIWVNGVSQAVAVTSTGTGTYATDAAVSLYVGDRTGDDRTLDGRVAAATLHTRVLSDEEIERQFAALAPLFLLPATAFAGASTDNAVARFDGTSGTLQDSSVTVSDAGGVTLDSASPTLTTGDGTGSPTIALAMSAAADEGAVSWLTSGFTSWRAYAQSGDAWTLARHNPATGALQDNPISVEAGLGGSITLSGGSITLSAFGSVVTGGLSVGPDQFAGDPGYMSLADSHTDAVNKVGAIITDSYANANGAVSLLNTSNEVAANRIMLGGGVASLGLSAATSLEFYTAAAVATDAGTLRFDIDSAGAATFANDLTVEGDAVMEGSLDVAPAKVTIGAGQLYLGSTDADATNKTGIVLGRHYTNASGPWVALRTLSNSSANQVQIGGGAGGIDAATAIEFYTASALNTDTGTLRFSIDPSGVVACAGELEVDGDLNHDGSNVGFYGTTPGAKPTVTGSRGGNAALASLLTALAGLGLITDSST